MGINIKSSARKRDSFNNIIIKQVQEFDTKWEVAEIDVPCERDDAVGVGVVIPQAGAEATGVGQNLRHCQRHHCSSNFSRDQFIISDSFTEFLSSFFFSSFISQGVNKGVSYIQKCFIILPLLPIKLTRNNNFLYCWEISTLWQFFNQLILIHIILSKLESVIQTS